MLGLHRPSHPSFSEPLPHVEPRQPAPRRSPRLSGMAPALALLDTPDAAVAQPDRRLVTHLNLAEGMGVVNSIRKTLNPGDLCSSHAPVLQDKLLQRYANVFGGGTEVFCPMAGHPLWIVLHDASVYWRFSRQWPNESGL